MSLLLVCLFAIIVLVIAVCLAVRFCNLENVDLSANITRFAAVRFSVTGRPPGGSAHPKRGGRSGRNKRKPKPPAAEPDS